ncbi:MAG: hypothetical protein DWQ05_20245 [Calditrichaeota bacterium]|nr:MAG: hypothetical protein DWQ05_20245 [Calditrichota bacterium]
MQFFKLGNFSFGVFFIEVFSIVFGVLLALGGNEIRESYNEQQRVDAAMLSIKTEMTGNKNFIENRLPYYQSVVDTLEQVMKKHGKNASFYEVKIPGFQGINPPLLRDSSLQTAIATQAFASFEFKKADQISMVYSFQSTYLKWIDIYLNAFAVKDKPTIGMLNNLFQEMVKVGSELSATYQQTLDSM